MSNSRAEHQHDDELEAMGRLERRHLLLRLATASRDRPRVDFSGVADSDDELDPLVAMRHVHLPVLEEREFIRWDRENQWITKGPRFDELEPFLELFREIRRDLPDRDVTETSR